MPLFSHEMFSALLPELGLTLLALILLVISLLKNERINQQLEWITAAGFTVIAMAMVLFARPPAEPQLLWGEAVRFDQVGFIFRLMILAGSALTAVFSKMEPAFTKKAEFFLLLVISTIGLSLMVASGNLITLYLAIETAALPLYVMAGFNRESDKSVEAGMKYFLFGAVSSALMLYGFTLLYGFAGTTKLYGMVNAIQQNGASSAGVVLAFLLVLAGFTFKMSAVPFHFWAPDVYQGSPTPVSGFLSTVSKAAGFAAFIRVIVNVFAVGSSQVWMVTIAVVAVLSMFVGNLLAITQKDIKRMIAYSSIAQAGYILVGVATGSELGFSGALYYLLAYLVTNLAVFAIIHWVEQKSGSTAISAFAGLNRRSPGMALLMMLGLLSLGGIPPFAGFFAKVLVFGSAVKANMVWLAVLGIFNSVIGLYYYLRVMKVMYLDPPTETQWDYSTTFLWKIALAVCIIGILVLGVVYAPWFNQLLLAAGDF